MKQRGIMGVVVVYEKQPQMKIDLVQMFTDELKF